MKRNMILFKIAVLVGLKEWGWKRMIVLVLVKSQLSVAIDISNFK